MHFILVAEQILTLPFNHSEKRYDPILIHALSVHVVKAIRITYLNLYPVKVTRVPQAFHIRNSSKGQSVKYPIKINLP